VRVGLAPGRAALGFTGGWTGKVAAVGVKTGDSADWAGTLSALRWLLEQAGLRGKAKAVLSNHFFRFLLTPPMPRLRAGEREAFVRLAFEERFGEPMGEWIQRFTPVPDGEATVACALPRFQLEELRALLAEHAMPLASVQPWLMAATNRWRHRLGRGDAWLVLAEPDRLCLARLSRGAWRSLLCSKPEGDLVQSLSAGMAREALARGEASPARMYLHAGGLPWPADLPGMQLNRLVLPAVKGHDPQQEPVLGYCL
jgi:hypothetical protein